MKKAIKFEIERAEGTQQECVKRTVNSWASANDLLNSMSHTAPAGGGYHKTDFKITFEDGLVYQGRVDLTRERSQNLGRHVSEFAACYSGRVCPSHIKREDFKRLMAMYSAEDRAAYGRILDEYDLDGWNGRVG